MTKKEKVSETYIFEWIADDVEIEWKHKFCARSDCLKKKKVFKIRLSFEDC